MLRVTMTDETSLILTKNGFVKTSINCCDHHRMKFSGEREM